MSNEPRAKMRKLFACMALFAAAALMTACNKDNSNEPDTGPNYVTVNGVKSEIPAFDSPLTDEISLYFEIDSYYYKAVFRYALPNGDEVFIGLCIGGDKLGQLVPLVAGSTAWLVEYAHDFADVSKENIWLYGHNDETEDIQGGSIKITSVGGGDKYKVEASLKGVAGDDIKIVYEGKMSLYGDL